MGLFGYLLRTSRRAFLLAVAASVISGGTGAAFIALVNLGLERGDRPGAGLVAAYVGLCVVTLATRFLSQSLLFRLSQGAIRDLRRTMIDAILGARLRGLEKIGSAPLYSTLSDDVVVIADALPGLPQLVSGAAFVVVCLGYLSVLSPLVALAALVATAVGVGVYRAFGGYGMRSLSAARAEQDQLFEHFRGVTEGIKELKLNRHRRRVIAHDRLDRTADSYRRHSIVGLSIFEGAGGGGQAVFFTLIGVMLFALPGTGLLGPRTLAAAVLTLLFAVSSLQAVLTWLPVMGRASVALTQVEQRLAALAEAGHDVIASPITDADPMPHNHFARWRRIQLRGVTHTYHGPKGEEFVLGPLDLTLRRGETLFVVGANGSGKTTFAKLLTSLYPPQAGSVCVDGVEVSDLDREEYRQLFSTVFADFFLFDDLAGTGAGSDDGSTGQQLVARAESYLRRLELDHKVSIVDGRLSTTALSRGQRKRLALLLAYLEDRSVYVFDEWAADQDPVFKDFFYTELLPELAREGKAVVAITHDDAYFHLADRVVRLDYGQIRPEEIPSAPTMVGRRGPGSRG